MSRVSMKMRILVIMSDNRCLDANPDTAMYNSFTASINYSYCQKHGYDFRYYQVYNPHARDTIYNTIDPNASTWRHCAWAKLLVLIRTLQEGVDYDYVVYIDSDCAFKNHDIPMESLIAKHSGSDWGVLFFDNYPWNPDFPCSGFMICRQAASSTSTFLHDWFHYLNPSSDSLEWEYVMEKANPDGDRWWEIGTHWEQDTLWLLIQHENRAQPYGICIDHSEVMFEDRPYQYLRHICHIHSLEERTMMFRTMAMQETCEYLRNMQSLKPIPMDVSTMAA